MMIFDSYLAAALHATRHTPVARVRMARGNQLEDIEEHDDENFLLYYVFLEAYRMLSYFSSFVCVLFIFLGAYRA